MSDEALAQEQAQDTSVPADGQGQEEQAAEAQEQRLLAGKYKTPEDLEKAYGDLSKKLGDRFAVLEPPGDDASEDQRQAFKAKMRELQGVPEKPEDYGLKVPENLNEERFNEFLVWAHGQGMSPKQVEAFMELSTAEQTAVQEARADQVNGWHDMNKVAEKDQYKANTNLLDRFFALVSPDGKLKEVAGDAIHHPEVRKSLLQAAQFVPEPKLKGSGEAAPRDGAIPTKAELQKMLRDPRYMDPMKRDPEYVAKVEKAYQLVHGEDGTDGEVYTTRL